MQIQSTKTYQLTPVRMTISKILQTVNAEGAVEKCVPSSLSEAKLVRDTNENGMEVPLRDPH